MRVEIWNICSAQITPYMFRQFLDPNHPLALSSYNLSSAPIGWNEAQRERPLNL